MPVGFAVAPAGGVRWGMPSSGLLLTAPLGLAIRGRDGRGDGVSCLCPDPLGAVRPGTVRPLCRGGWPSGKPRCIARTGGPASPGGIPQAGPCPRRPECDGERVRASFTGEGPGPPPESPGLSRSWDSIWGRACPCSPTREAAPRPWFRLAVVWLVELCENRHAQSVGERGTSELTVSLQIPPAG